jgi:Protein of unknown function (DUF2844)
MLVVITACVLLLMPAVPPPAWAALGEPAASVERDRVMMKGQRQSRSAIGYSVDTLTVAGMQIKEYVSPDGIVFAVVWKGTGMPDLRVLLGDYFDDYRSGVTAARGRAPRVRQPFRMKSERLVVERAGHSRSSWGRAYLPTYIPGGMQPEDIQ